MDLDLIIFLAFCIAGIYGCISAFSRSEKIVICRWLKKWITVKL